MPRRPTRLSVLATVLVLSTAACAATAPAAPTSPADGTVLRVVASINSWGSIVSQLGGKHVRATSIITNPDTDPHDYEPTPADARAIADSKLFVENGIGYDPWAERSLAASPDPRRIVLDVGATVGVATGGNPHRWYAPRDVETVADAITSDLMRLDPADASYYQTQRQIFETTGLADYHRLIHQISATYAGTPIGASESIVTPLADALGLALVTPPSFLQAISEGIDPSAEDKATIDAQIAQRKIKVYVVNTQNATPDVSAQVAEARRNGIPVVGVTETLSPANVPFAQWQSAQLTALRDALAHVVRR